MSELVEAAMLLHVATGSAELIGASLGDLLHGIEVAAARVQGGLQGLRSPSITSSARASSAGGTEMSSAVAVWRLIARLNLVGCSTGRSAGFAPW